RIAGAGKQTYRLVTTLLDPFLYPAKELAVVYHERWHVELVINEARTYLRLSARTLRSLTPEGVIQEISALLVAHVVVRTLMLRAAELAQISPTRDSVSPRPFASWMTISSLWGWSASHVGSTWLSLCCERSALNACLANGYGFRLAWSNVPVLAMTARNLSI